MKIKKKNKKKHLLHSYVHSIADVKRLLYLIDSKKVSLIKQPLGSCYDVDISFKVVAKGNYSYFNDVIITIFEDCCEWDYISAIKFKNKHYNYYDIYPKIKPYDYLPPSKIIEDVYHMQSNVFSNYLDR
jgi:hypothetical protein